MIAVDTNVLIYAHRRELPLHDKAVVWIEHLATGDVPWSLPVFCLGEFLRVATHRRVFDPPSTVDQAIDALSVLLRSPSLQILFPGSRFAEFLTEQIRVAAATGNMVFDAQIAAVCRENGVDRLLTEDRDFSRFPQLRIETLDADPVTSI